MIVSSSLSKRESSINFHLVVSQPALGGPAQVGYNPLTNTERPIFIGPLRLTPHVNQSQGQKALVF